MIVTRDGITHLKDLRKNQNVCDYSTAIFMLSTSHRSELHSCKKWFKVVTEEADKENLSILGSKVTVNLEKLDRDFCEIPLASKLVCSCASPTVV
jgi:hypothetical protein